MQGGRYSCPVSRCDRTYEGRDALVKHVKSHGANQGTDPTLQPFSQLSGGRKERSTSEIPESKVAFLSDSSVFTNSTSMSIDGMVQESVLTRNALGTALAAGPFQVFSESNTDGEQCLSHSGEGKKKMKDLAHW